MLKSFGAQFTRFAMAGGAGTGVHYLVLIALVSLAGIAPGRAAFMGAAVGAGVIYLLNRRYTFASSCSHAQALPRFVLMAAVGAALNGMLVGLLSGAGVYFLLAQMMATGLILVINFIVSKLWIFR